MPDIELHYGDTLLSFRLDPDRFEVLGSIESPCALNDIELGHRLDSPIGSRPLEDIVLPGEKVLIVVPDATRKTGAGQVVNLLVRRLISHGTAPHEISVLIATGIHRGVTEEEKREILTPFIVQRLKVFVHSARDLMETAGLESHKFTEYGRTARGTRVRLNGMLSEYDRVVTVGGVSFHYFAGFTGGRKLICPGLAAEETISATHKLAFDCTTRSRREGVGPGVLEGNAVHEEFMAVTDFRPPDFSIDTIVNDSGEVVDVFCGDWGAAHSTACKVYGERHTVEIDAKRELVIVSCGGSPHDLNMIQAHKALDNAARGCVDGGTIVLVAECRDGLGRSDFLNWFDSKDSCALAERLCDDYQVNGQTAWSLLDKCERFNVRVVTALSADAAAQMRMTRCDSLEEAVSGLSADATGFVIPSGAKILVTEKVKGAAR